MKILFISPVVIDTCSFYRSGGIAPDLREKLGMDIDVVSWDKGMFHWQTLMDYNLVMMQRPYTDMALSMGNYIRDLGIPLWVDYDDNTLDVPPGNKAYETMLKQRETIKKIMMIADVLTVTTQELKRQLRDFNDNITIIPNAFNDTIFRKRETSISQRIIAWRGGDSHFADIFLMGGSLIGAIKKYPEWVFSFLGFNPWFLGPHKNLFYVPAQDPLLYFKNIAKLAPYVFHVPLVDSKFNRCKSNIAYIEASYSGALCLAPDWEEWKVPGILSYKDEKEFSASIEAIIQGRIDVRKLSNKAWEYITDNLMLSKVNNLRADLVKKLLSLK